MFYSSITKIWLSLAALVFLVMYVCPPVLGNAVCLRCDNLPHPRDCDRAVECNAHELCYVEQLVTESGNVVYNSGCASEQKCKSGKTKRNSVLYANTIDGQISSYDNAGGKLGENHVDEVSWYETAEADLTTCYDCCNATNYCNRDLCDYGTQVSRPNQTYCLSCPDVVQPSDCEYLVQCNPGEICYTEFMNLNGEERYRLGCISPTACSKTPASNPGPALVGKKRYLMSGMTVDKYCSKCCKDDIGNCNRELCDSSGTKPAGTEVLELVNPPERQDFCTDLYPTACPLLIIENPKLCLESRYSHYACREYCGTCTNPGHITAKPTPLAPTGGGSGTSGAAVTTMTTTPKMMSSGDCFYESTRYIGSISSTVSGKSCLRWSELSPTPQNLPDATVTIAGNKCRDPDGRGFPWCYTSKTLEWGFCPVPYCQECFYQNKSTQYAGYVAKDNENNTCLPWTDYFASSGISVKNVEKLKNFCRDPMGSGTPQCYNGNKLKNCDVPVCPHECRDKPVTNCDLVKQYVCQSEFTSVTLCPQTCSSCHFGLLPPKQVDPPKDLCVDNADASCETIQFIICADPVGALNLCPKTCGLCSLLYSKTTTSPNISTATTVFVPSPSAHSSTAIAVPTHLTSNVSPTTMPVTQTTTPKTPLPTQVSPTTKPPIFWLPWGHWKCELQPNGCFQRRFRTCSTGTDKDCADKYGGFTYDIGLCSNDSCPDLLTTSTVAPAPSTVAPTTDPCQDDPSASGCQIKEIRDAVCKDIPSAWSFCPRSCGLCDTCWDFLNCSSQSAQKLFCGREQFALQYCRKTCGRCSHKPVHVQINSCNDPVASEQTCVVLHQELCICNDDSIRALCQNYCDKKCTGFPLPNPTCRPIDRRRRDEILQRLLLV